MVSAPVLAKNGREALRGRGMAATPPESARLPPIRNALRCLLLQKPHATSASHVRASVLPAVHGCPLQKCQKCQFVGGMGGGTGKLSSRLGVPQNRRSNSRFLNSSLMQSSPQQLSSHAARLVHGPQQAFCTGQLICRHAITAPKKGPAEGGCRATQEGERALEGLRCPTKNLRPQNLGSRVSSCAPILPH